MLYDRYGNALATTSHEAADNLDQAYEQLRIYQGDPIASLDAALAHDPDFMMAWAVRAGVLVQQADKAYLEEAERSLRAGMNARAGDDRARALLAAAQDWAEGRYAEGTVRYARIAQECPRDLFAVQSAHLGCFYLGWQHELRDWSVQALRAYGRGDEGRHALLGMAAFGTEECGDYARAEDMGREAVALEPRDAWAAHSVAHVYEMRGDTESGMPWLKETARGWADGGLAFHNWWHLALLHLDRGEHQAALDLYDAKVCPDPATPVLLQWVDASAMLWRLMLEGADVGSRFAPVADMWTRTIDDGFYAFNDLHAVMAFLGAGRINDAYRVRAVMRRVAEEASDNGAMTRQVGLPVVEGFIAFAEGRNAACVDHVLAARPMAQRFGGSHAQRDVLSLTALHAAIRGGVTGAAEALAAERLAHKPESPWARTLARRAVPAAVAAE